MERETPAINALCEALINGLKHHFSFLLESKIHQSATALDPRIKLTFTDNANPSKFFLFSSTIVKQHITSFLPSQQALASITPTPPVTDGNNGAKRRRLLDYSFTCLSEHSRSSANVELNTYLENPVIQADPVLFWSLRPETTLSTLAFQLMSIPCSSAPVERLFSKAGILLQQRRTRLKSTNLEQLLFSNS